MSVTNYNGCDMTSITGIFDAIDKVDENYSRNGHEPV